MRRVRVEWTTRDVQSWSAVFEVPEEVPDDQIGEYFDDGDCPELVEWDGDTHVHDGTMVEFLREIDSVAVLPDGN